MNEKALEQLNKNIDELRTLLHDVGTVAAVFKTITLLRSVLGERERNIDLRHPTNKPSFFWGINLRVGAADLVGVSVQVSEPEFLALREAATLLGMHWKVLRRAIEDGELRAYKLRSRIRIRRADLDEWVESNRVKPSVHDI